MKKYLFGLFVAVLLLTPGLTHAINERVLSFDAEIKINQDASALVTEKIVYDLGNQDKHGIFRYIPYKYQLRDGSRLIKIEDISVGDDSGPVKFTTKKSGGQLEIKIGDPNIFVNGIKTYVLSYRVVGAMNYFDQYDEFYWNVSGNGWEAPIESIKATVIYPGGTQKDSAKAACFAGALKTTDPCREALLTEQGGTVAGNFSHPRLIPGDGLTIVAGFPKNLVEVLEPIKGGILSDIFGIDSSIALVLVLTAIFLPAVVALYLMFRVWRKSGRDPKLNSAVPAQFDPPKNMTPIEVGTIMNDKIDNKLASAELIYLAQQGYLKINKINKKNLIFNQSDYEIVKIKPLDQSLTDYDRAFFSELLGSGDSIKLSELKNDQSGTILVRFQALKKGVFRALTDKKLYRESPHDVHLKYFGIAGGLAVVAVIFGVIWIFLLPISIGLGLASGVVALFAFIMPAKTELGAKAKEHVIGFKEYLSVAEKDRLKILNAPVAEPAKFETYLPYAMALGVEKEWAKQFEGIYNGSPSWYNDPSNRMFNAVIFTNVMGDFGKGFNGAVFASAAAAGSSGFSSGGGFSGGGFGGGGGGSW